MKPLVQLVVLGGGLIGKTIAFFAKKENWDVVLVDPFLTQDNLDSDPIFNRNVNMIVEPYNRVDLVQEDGFEYMKRPFAPGTYVINTIPVYDPVRVRELVERVITGGGHYLDISEDIECSRMLLKNFGSHTGNMIAPHCGLAPGMTTIQAANMMKQFATVLDVTIMVGALPVSVSNWLQHYPTWSATGLINEYINPNVCITDYQAHERKADLSNYQRVVVDGIGYESCATSGGLGTMVSTCDRINKQADLNEVEDEFRVKSLEYRTLRHPGHWQISHNIMKKGRQYDPSIYREIITNEFNEGADQDQVVIHITVQGKKEFNSKPTVARYTRILKGETPFLAIQMTTAYGPLLMVDCHARKLLPTKYIAQEDVVLTDGIKSSAFNWLDPAYYPRNGAIFRP